MVEETWLDDNFALLDKPAVPPVRKRLLEYLRSLLVEETPTVSSNKKAPYTQSLALAGTMHSLHTDVSSDKYKHLAEAYADRHEDQ